MLSVGEDGEAEPWWTLMLSETGGSHKRKIRIKRGQQRAGLPSILEREGACVAAEARKAVSGTRQKEQPSRTEGYVWMGECRGLPKAAEEGGEDSSWHRR